MPTPEEIGLATQLDMSGFDAGMKRYMQAIDSMVSETGRVASSIGSQLTSLGGTITHGLETATKAIVGIAIGVGTAVANTGLDFNAMKESATIAFSTMLDDGEKAKAFLDELEGFAAKTPFAFEDLTKASQRLLAMGFAAEEILPMMSAIGDTVAGLGGGAPEIDRVTRALGQMQAKGRVQAGEMQQLAELGIPVWDILAKTLNTTVADAMDQVSKGAVSAAVAIPALVEGMSKQFGGLMDKQSRSWKGLTSTIKDNFAILSGNVMSRAFDGIKDRLAKIVDITSSPAFVEGTKKLGEWVGVVVEKMLTWVEGVLPKVLSFMQSIANSISVILSGDITGGIFGMNSSDPFIQFLLAAREGLQWLTQAVKDAYQWVQDVIVPFIDWKDVLVAAGIAVGLFIAPMVAAAAQMALVAAGAVAAVALIRHAWEDDFGGIRTFVEENWGGIQGVIQTAMEAIQGIIATVGAIIQGDWSTVWTNVSNAAAMIWDGLKDVWSAALGALTQYLTDHMPAWSAALGEWATVAWQWLVDAAGVLVEKAGEWWVALAQYVDDHKEEWATKLAGWAGVAWQWIVDASKVVGEKLAGWWSILSQYVVDHKGEWATTLGEWAVVAWEWIVNAGKLLGEKLGAWFTILTNWYNDNKGTFATKLGEWATAAWQWIVDAAKQVGPKLVEWYTALRTAVDEYLPLFATKLSEWATAAWQWIVDAAGSIGGYLGDWYITISTWLGTNLPIFATKLSEWAKEAWQWIIDASSKINVKMGEWYEAIKLWLDQNYPKFETTMVKWGDALVAWITNSKPETHENFFDWYGALMGGVGQKFIDFEKGLIQWTTALVTWIGNAVPNMIAAMVTLVDDLVAWIQKPGAGGGVGNIAAGLVSWVNAFKDWVTGPGGLIAQLVPEWAKLGEAVITAIRNIAASITVAKAAIDGLFVEALKFVGTAIISGITAGLDAATGGLMTKIGELGAKMLTAMDQALDSHSPSRKFMLRGEWSGEGMILGMNKTLEAVQKKASELAQAAVSGVQGWTNGIASSSPITAASASATSNGASADTSNVQSALQQAINQQVVLGQQARTNAALVQSYATTNNNSNTFGPNYISTPMDWAEMEFRIGNIIKNSL